MKIVMFMVWLFVMGFATGIIVGAAVLKTQGEKAAAGGEGMIDVLTDATCNSKLPDDPMVYKCNINVAADSFNNPRWHRDEMAKMSEWPAKNKSYPIAWLDHPVFNQWEPSTLDDKEWIKQRIEEDKPVGKTFTVFKGNRTINASFGDVQRMSENDRWRKGVTPAFNQSDE